MEKTSSDGNAETDFVPAVLQKNSLHSGEARIDEFVPMMREERLNFDVLNRFFLGLVSIRIRQFEFTTGAPFHDGRT